MNRQELEHIIRAAANITGEKEFILIGSQSILGAVPDAPKTLRGSMEADIYPKNKPQLSEAIEGSIGRYSAFHNTFKYYADGVSPETATLPKGWETRLVPVKSENTNGATGWCISVHDLAYSKLAAGREKDLEFVTEMSRHGLLKVSTLEKLLATAPEDKKGTMQGRWQRILKVHTKSLGQQALDKYKSQAAPAPERGRDDSARSL